VLLFMLGSLLFLLVFGGFAIDLAFYSTAKGELQRSMDAASLAGAGQLSFGDSVFPTVRQEAQNFANLNPTRANLSDLNPTGAISLDLNTGNDDPDGDIVLGIWDGATFTPSTDGTQVNAVQCQYATDVPTSFLGILGFNTLPVSARAIAVANPPNALPPGQCMFPAGVTACTFEGTGPFSSQGCGTAMTFKNSSGAPPPDGNTAAWVNPNGTVTPNASMLRDALAAVANGDMCNPLTPLTVGDDVGTNNGMAQDVMSDLVGYFQTKYDDSVDSGEQIQILDENDNVRYEGYGWEVFVALIETDCPFPGPISGDHQIQTFAKFIITQVINKGDCAVDNPSDTNSAPLCGTSSPSFRGVFGYYDCSGTIDGTVATSGSAPRAGIARRRRLVQ
jgi:Flp pilus assembly protein TadG